MNFNIVKGLNGIQAIDITGINGGPLMCDIVMGSRRIGEPYPAPMQGIQGQQGIPIVNPDWQTVPRRPYVPKTAPVDGQGNQGAQRPTSSRPVKNYNKYNKATRNVPQEA